ncbi:MAG: sulfatase [Bryobacteraceae bacterium]
MIPSRRSFLAGMPALTGLARKSGAERPNFLFILTDDQRWDSLSVAGHPVLRTPGMDRIAREGARFENAFCTTSLCSPSRASFLTGCYARRHGVKDNSTPLPANTPTFGTLLRDAGYHTAHIGKWHMDGMLERPGFDFSVTFQGQGAYTNPELRFNGEARKVPGYLTDLLTGYAAEWLERPRQAPFCMYFGHKACHLPVVPAERHRGAFPDARLPVPVSAADTLAGKPEWVKRRRQGKTGVVNHPNYDLNHRNYLRTLLAGDESVARLLETLERLRLLDSTVVVFAGDNGFFHGEHGLTNKRAMYEEAIRIPFLLRYPPLARAGTVVREMALNIDLAPTFLELAGVKAPASVQGRSLVPLLAGREPALRQSFLYEYYREESFADTPSIEGIRTRRWKYITYPGTREIDELYDLQADPHELRNLAGERAAAAQLARMRKELAGLLRASGRAHVTPVPRAAYTHSQPRSQS